MTPEVSESPFKQLAFKFTWRDYQAKFLANFKDHLRDNHLHVVAPPGSGKTILGLEMLLRIGNNTLVLSPSLTIRNQWQSRLQEFFISEIPFTNYTTSLSELKAINFSTYQAVHALDKRLAEDDNEDLAKILSNANIKTLVLDEAHHLKNEWWKVLWKLKEIEGLTIIALTATPPYDSPFLEQQKYFRLCGPIDDEIAVPDLVKNNDLCPHQDYIHFSFPDEVALKKIVKYRTATNTFLRALQENKAF